MDIKGTTRVCGLIGNPVGHSVSPAIHNNLAQLTGKDMVYTTFKVEKGDVASAVRGAYSLNILGLNVTVPHKSEVIDSLVDIDPLAKAIGAVNTLVRVDGGFKGYNTDILGLADREVTIKLTSAAKDYIVENGYDPMYGARPLRRYLQKTVETLSAKLILSGNVDAGDEIVIDVDRTEGLVARTEKPVA